MPQLNNFYIGAKVTYINERQKDSNMITFGLVQNKKANADADPVPQYFQAVAFGHWADRAEACLEVGQYVMVEGPLYVKQMDVINPNTDKNMNMNVISITVNRIGIDIGYQDVKVEKANIDDDDRESGSGSRGKKRSGSGKDFEESSAAEGKKKKKKKKKKPEESENWDDE